MTGADTHPAEEIAHRAQQFKVVVLAQQLTLVTLVDEGRAVLRFHQTLAGIGPDADLPVVLSDGPGHEDLVVSAREVLAAAAQLRGAPIRDLMTMSMMTAATQLGDMIVTGGHSRQDVPLLQFACHFRNAAAHGNRWHFGPGEPKNPATCRHLTLTPDLHGQRAAWGTVTPKLFALYLDDLANYFIPGLVPEVTGSEERGTLDG